MAYITIDIDIDEFDTQELVDELITRLKKVGRRGVSGAQRTQLIDTLSELNEVFFNTSFIELKTLDDKIKYGHIIKVFDKYTPLQFESKLPE